MPLSNPPQLPQQQSWQTMTPLLNGWTNYGFDTAAAGFWKDSLGVVHLRGAIGNSQQNPGDIFVLPAQYRPEGEELFVIVSLGFSGGYKPGMIQIEPDGRILWMDASSVRIAALTGITFRAYP